MVILERGPHHFIEKVQQTNHWRGRQTRITRIVGMDGQFTVEIIGIPVGLSNIRVTDKTNGTQWSGSITDLTWKQIESMRDMTIPQIKEHLKKLKKGVKRGDKQG